MCESSAREGNAERHGAAWSEDRGARGEGVVTACGGRGVRGASL